MRVVSMVVMLGLGLTLGLPQHTEYKEEESPRNELKQGSNLYNEGPNQDSVVNQVEQEPQFDAVKDNELEPEQRVDVIKRLVEEEVQEGHDATKGLCRKYTCKNGGTCYDNAGDFSCACTTGWEGPRCGVWGLRKDNELEPEQRVDVIKRSVEEEVQEGHDATKGLCRKYTCKNGGTCYDNAGDFSCACTTGWEGTRCEDEWAGPQEPQDHKEGTPH